MPHALTDSHSPFPVETGDAAANDTVKPTSPTWPAEPPRTRSEVGRQISPTLISPEAIGLVLAALAALILLLRG